MLGLPKRTTQTEEDAYLFVLFLLLLVAGLVLVGLLLVFLLVLLGAFLPELAQLLANGAELDVGVFLLHVVPLVLAEVHEGTSWSLRGVGILFLALLATLSGLLLFSGGLLLGLLGGSGPLSS